jgi:hypothetical protein
MTARETTAPPDATVPARFGRWLLAKVWLGCLLSAVYAVGRHFGLPQALQSVAALFGALALALAVTWLPIWTRERPTGIAVVDVGLRAIVWAGLVLSVLALLIGTPQVGAVAGALLLSTAWRTFGHGPSISPRSVLGRIAHAGPPPRRRRPAAPEARRARPATSTTPGIRSTGRTTSGPQPTGHRPANRRAAAPRPSRRCVDGRETLGGMNL